MNPRFYFITAVLAVNVVLSGQVLAAERVAIVKSRSLGPYEQAVEGIREGLGSGRADITVYDLEGKPEKATEIAGLIQKSEAKVAFAVGSEAASALKGSIGSTPLVLAMIFDPLEDGLVAKPDEPGVYGANLRVPFERQFEVLKRTLPEFKRLALVHRKEAKARIARDASTAASTSGIQLTLIPIDDMDQFPAALERASKESQALLMILDPDMYNKSTVKELLLFSARKRYPVIAPSSNYVQAGALLSIAPGFKDNGLTAGRIGARLLDGQSVSPHFGTTEKTQLAWNSRVADLLKISSPRAESEADETF